MKHLNLESNTPRRKVGVWAAAIAVACVAGCTVGPNYVRPTAEVPDSFKELGADWRQSQPSDAADKGKWWEVYQDSQLNALEDQIAVSNQSLKVAQAQFDQARAAVRITRAAQFPTVTVNPNGGHFHESSTRSSATNLAPTEFSDYQIPFDASYEADVWGRVRRTVEASRSEAQASAGDLANVELSLRAELALDYFQLRGLDAQQALLDSTVASYEKALELTEQQYNGGLTSAVTVAEAQTQLETTRAQAVDVGVQRAAFEHAIAVLVGKPVAKFSLPPQPLTVPPPQIPPGLPSQLLERRPDVSAAERRMQEANANIGVAKAAYYPTITLSPTGGFESGAVSTLIQGPSGFWSIGANALETIFDAGRRRGVTEQAIAAYNQNVATYRQTVLSAFQDVEDNLAALRILEQEAATEEGAVKAAEHSLSLSLTRYRGGVTSYLEVTTAQTVALSDEVTAVNILTRRMTASVSLVKAVGGGWNVSQIPHI